METPFINQRNTIVVSDYIPLNHTQAIICVNLATLSANLVAIGVNDS
jgi:Cu/Ag efflux pump CusA